ncbi:MAG: hypothetical protein M3R47_00095 [Chloroflexota bacterium]|nr:hypothetical protein [Chloroflexota bacterium]
MKLPSSIYIRIVIALGSIVVYAIIFPILYPLAGEATAAFTVIPMAAVGWFLGGRGSLLFGILTVPLHNFLLRLVGAPVQLLIVVDKPVGVEGSVHAGVGCGVAQTF